MSTLLAWCTFFYTREKLLSSSAVLLQFEKRTGTPVLLGTVLPWYYALRTKKEPHSKLKKMRGSSFSKREKKLHFLGLKNPAYSSQPLISYPEDTMIMSFQ